jgi:hypothetical protein
MRLRGFRRHVGPFGPLVLGHLAAPRDNPLYNRS